MCVSVVRFRDTWWFEGDGGGVRNVQALGILSADKGVIEAGAVEVGAHEGCTRDDGIAELHVAEVSLVECHTVNHRVRHVST